jgi:HEAT repeat protein
MNIDWNQINHEAGGIDGLGNELPLGMQDGGRVIELILGEDNIRSAVECWADRLHGAFAAQAFLRIARSRLAMEHCYQIYKANPNSSRANRAVYLLSEIAESEALPMMAEIINDPDFNHRWHCVIAMEQILSGPIDDEEIEIAKAILSKGESDTSPRLRERAAEIRERLKNNPRLDYLNL